MASYEWVMIINIFNTSESQLTRINMHEKLLKSSSHSKIYDISLKLMEELVKHSLKRLGDQI